MNNNHLVIMAGGIGSRFWPMSRTECPKQFIDVLGVGKSLIQLTVERFGNLFAMNNIWVVTSSRYYDLVCEQLPSIPASNILLEPCMRNTAPCIGYVAWKIKQRCPEATIVVSPADHFVLDAVEFRRVIAAGIGFVKGTSNVLTLGMKPTNPNTGYGYIETGTPTGTEGICQVSSFKEKPTRDVAQRYLDCGTYYWNAGIFVWDVGTIEAALRTFEPEMAAVFDSLTSAFYSDSEQGAVNDLFPQCRSISIDYAVMERLSGHAVELCGRPAGVFVMPADFGWSDLGTWGSLYERIGKDEAGNAVAADGVAMVESTNCIVRTSGNIRMVLQGLDGYVVAEDNRTLLICRKDQEQRIKEFSEKLDQV